MDLWLVSMAMFIVSSLLGGLNYISTHSQYAHQGHEHDQVATYRLGLVLYSGAGCVIFPGFVIRRYPVIVRPQPGNQFLFE
jgi:cytochrome c oxidase subunit 1